MNNPQNIRVYYSLSVDERLTFELLRVFSRVKTFTHSNCVKWRNYWLAPGIKVKTMNLNLKKSIEFELELANSLAKTADFNSAFYHLERAHVLGQASTYQHTRIHWRMFRLAIRQRSAREIWGQIVRLIGASTKTPFGIYPVGNTGGANVWFFKSMPVPPDLREIMNNGNQTACGDPKSIDSERERS